MMLVTPVMRQPQMMQAKRPPERHLAAILHQSIKRQPGHHPAVFLQKTQKLLTAPCSKIEQRSRERYSFHNFSGKNQLIPVIINLNMGWISISLLRCWHG
jgi:hypothetical protein